MWDLSSPIRDPTRTPGIGRQSLNRWTAREVPYHCTLKRYFTSPAWEGKYPYTGMLELETLADLFSTEGKPLSDMS